MDRNRPESVLVLFLTVCFLASRTNGGISNFKSHYTTKYDDINLDDILANKRLLQIYVKCLLNEAPCTKDGVELKRSIPEAIATDCTKCSEKQKAGSTKVIHFLIDNEVDSWKKLEKLYDPSGEYKQRYLEQKEVKIVPITSTTEAV